MNYPKTAEDTILALHFTSNMRNFLSQFEHNVLNKPLDSNGVCDPLNEVKTFFKDLEELLK